MPPWVEIVLALLLGPVLWLTGAVFFDVVHWLLDVMLRSRVRLLRVLAWPHAVHHAWIGPALRVRWELQARNIAHEEPVPGRMEPGEGAKTFSQQYQQVPAGCGPGGRTFESCRARQQIRGLARLRDWTLLG